MKPNERKKTDKYKMNDETVQADLFTLVLEYYTMKMDRKNIATSLISFGVGLFGDDASTEDLLELVRDVKREMEENREEKDAIIKSFMTEIESLAGEIAIEQKIRDMTTLEPKEDDKIYVENINDEKKIKKEDLN